MTTNRDDQTGASRRALLLTGGMVLAHGTLAPSRPAAAATAHAAGGLLASPHSGGGGGAGGGNAAPTSFPTTDPELASAVVGAAHTDIETVRELVTARPHLAKASYDWGFGDWESALGAASHMGRRDIAELLLAHGARPNLFTAAMLGQLAVVRATIAASPGVQRIPGPHGLTLLHHARVGGEQAAAVHEYLEGLGDADLRPDSIELTEQQLEPLLGTYGFDAAENATIEVENNRGMLALRRAGQRFGRTMMPLSETEFFSPGSPTVRVVFQVDGGRAASFRVIDSEVLVTARRQG